EVDAREADRADEARRARERARADGAARAQVERDGGETSVEHGRERRVPAREAVRLLRREGRPKLRARAPERDLEDRREEEAAEDGPGEERGRHLVLRSKEQRDREERAGHDDALVRERRGRAREFRARRRVEA